jgi:hypothetical protein
MPLQSASTMIEASVIICTHNPRSDYLARVLDGLRNQTLPLDKWELLIIDNASRVPLASSWDISWHPIGRHILESELGLAPARRRGIQEASADLIIFVDDDNVLEETYLSEAVRIGQEWPPLGVWGSGCIRGDFEVEPPESIRSWLPVREVTGPRWSNLAGLHLLGNSPEEAIPWGAGLCVRKAIAIAYRQFCDQSSIEITDRQGTSLFSGGDTEISFVCCSHNLGIGIFPELELIHLIPPHRISEDYIIRFVEGTCLSNFLLCYKWQHIIPQPLYSIKTLLSILKTILLCRGVDRKMRFAWVRALVKAKKIIQADLRQNNSQVPEITRCITSQPPVGADIEISSQSVHPS